MTGAVPKPRSGLDQHPYLGPRQRIPTETAGIACVRYWHPAALTQSFITGEFMFFSAGMLVAHMWPCRTGGYWLRIQPKETPT